MTGCIVGWAHTQVRQARGARHRIADRRGRAGRARRCRRRGRRYRPGLSRHDERRLRQAGIPGLAGVPGRSRLPLQAGDPRRECLRHRLGGDPYGAQHDRRRQGAARAGRRRREDDRAVRRRRSTTCCCAPPTARRRTQIEGGFAGIFGQIAQKYFQRYGDQSDALARIAAKNHRNGVANPLAQMQRDLGYEFCRTVSEKNPIVAGPLKRTDCSLVSDGAAAVVLADLQTALALKKAVAFRAAEQVNDFLPMSRRDIVAFEGPELAWKRALAAARLGLDDLDLVETHDCFTIAELIEYEAMGLDAERRGRARDPRRLDREGRQAAGQPVGRAQIQGPPGRRHRRVDARAGLDAGHGSGRRHADPERQARRRHEHGRRRGRQFRQHPRTAAELIRVVRAGCRGFRADMPPP